MLISQLAALIDILESELALARLRDPADLQRAAWDVVEACSVLGVPDGLGNEVSALHAVLSGTAGVIKEEPSQ